MVRLLLAAGADPAPQADGVSVMDCIRNEKRLNEIAPIPQFGPPMFDRDFDAVLELLNRAMERRRPQ